MIYIPGNPSSPGRPDGPGGPAGQLFTALQAEKLIYIF